MKLKEYQDRALKEVKGYLEQIVAWRKRAAENPDLEIDFAAKAWEKADVGRTYIPKHDGLGRPLPMFCLKIPTGGGKDVKGNILTFNNPVFDAADKKQVGHDEGFCTRIAPKQGIWECLWTTFLRGGQITVQGPFYDTRNSVLSITGGTGAYRSARGEMVLKSRNGGKEYDFIFKLA